jgi:hypothetical protein
VLGQRHGAGIDDCAFMAAVCLAAMLHVGRVAVTEDLPCVSQISDGPGRAGGGRAEEGGGRTVHWV